MTSTIIQFLRKYNIAGEALQLSSFSNDGADRTRTRAHSSPFTENNEEIAALFLPPHPALDSISLQLVQHPFLLPLVLGLGVLVLRDSNSRLGPPAVLELSQVADRLHTEILEQVHSSVSESLQRRHGRGHDLLQALVLVFLVNGLVDVHYGTVRPSSFRLSLRQGHQCSREEEVLVRGEVRHGLDLEDLQNALRDGTDALQDGRALGGKDRE
mmetsp:Transcript_28934/g.53729  ORF Transcript_28934/g.53729 Transcript_28934/m.53729 type:complete len:213 (+) Transcript_28934:255-893(+)